MKWDDTFFLNNNFDFKLYIYIIFKNLKMSTFIFLMDLFHLI